MFIIRGEIMIAYSSPLKIVKDHIITVGPIIVIHILISEILNT